MKILIDNGHGRETPGKRSPEGRVREWSVARDIARRIVEKLGAMGRDAVLLVPEDADVPLAERCRRAGAWCRRLGRGNVVLVSVHVNAAGDGRAWSGASGWSAYVAPNASEASRRLASALAREAERAGFAVRRPAPGTDFWTASLAVCRDTPCPAVLTENLFMDNRGDAAMLADGAVLDRLAALHAAALSGTV